MSDGEVTPTSPLTVPKGKRDDPLNPASDLESDLYGLGPSLEAPRPRLQPGAGIRAKNTGDAMAMQGEEMKAIRKGLGMSQGAFGEALGMSRKAINEMEGGKAGIERRTELAARYVFRDALDRGELRARRSIGPVFLRLAQDEETDEGGDVWYIETLGGEILAVIHDLDRAEQIAAAWGAPSNANNEAK